MTAITPNVIPPEQERIDRTPGREELDRQERERKDNMSRRERCQQVGRAGAELRGDEFAKGLEGK